MASLPRLALGHFEHRWHGLASSLQQQRRWWCKGQRRYWGGGTELGRGGRAAGWGPALPTHTHHHPAPTLVLLLAMSCGGGGQCECLQRAFSSSAWAAWRSLGVGGRGVGRQAGRVLDSATADEQKRAGPATQGGWLLPSAADGVRFGLGAPSLLRPWAVHPYVRALIPHRRRGAAGRGRQPSGQDAVKASWPRSARWPASRHLVGRHHWSQARSGATGWGVERAGRGRGGALANCQRTRQPRARQPRQRPDTDLGCGCGAWECAGGVGGAGQGRKRARGERGRARARWG